MGGEGGLPRGADSTPVPSVPSGRLVVATAATGGVWGAPGVGRDLLRRPGRRLGTVWYCRGWPRLVSGSAWHRLVERRTAPCGRPSTRGARQRGEPRPPGQRRGISGRWWQPRHQNPVTDEPSAPFPCGGVAALHVPPPLICVGRPGPPAAWACVERRDGALDTAAVCA